MRSNHIVSGTFAAPRPSNREIRPMKRWRVTRLFRFSARTRQEVRADIHDEFQFHVDMRTDELVRSGLTEAEARAQALREFGDQASGAKVCARHDDRIERRRRITQFAGELRQDALFGLRLIAQSPGFAVVAILTLAVAIGANTATFTVVNALLFKPPPVAAPHELARIRPGQSHTSWPSYEDIRERNDVFSDVAALDRFNAALATRGLPVRLQGERTSVNYFSVLGVPAALGRTFTPADSRRDLLVLADRVWRARFGADPSVVGRILTLDGRPYEVLGVMPPMFRGVAPPGRFQDFWVPVDATLSNPALRDRRGTQFALYGRLKRGVTPAQATAAMRVMARQLKAEPPENFLAWEVLSIVGLDAFTGITSTLVPLFIFLALMTVVSGFVLLIGCANIAGLLLGRAAARRREIAVRLALGAGRGRLVRQLLTESLLLALMGGAAGVLLAIWLAGSLNTLAWRLPGVGEFDLGIDRRVLAYALGLTTLTCLLFGLVPARRAACFDVVSSLKQEGGSTTRQRLRQVLVVGQVAVCSLLLVWGGLFLRSLGQISEVDPGFDPVGVLLAKVTLGEGPDEDRARGERIFAELQQRVGDAPGVQSVGMARLVPLALTGRETFYVRIEGDRTDTEGRPVVVNKVTPGWLETVRIPLLAGRDFTWDDHEGRPGVVIVNETLARQFWDGDALGKHLNPGPDSWEVVGIARDSKFRTLGETSAPAIYRPLRQAYESDMTLHVRTDHMQATGNVIEREMQRIAPEVAVDIEPMTEAVAVAVLPAQIGAAITGAIGMVAMLLSTLGVYGLVSFSVVQRTREIGVRKALGARTPDIIRLVVGGSAALTAVGLAVGLGVGALGANVLRGFLTGVSPMDPRTLTGVALLVMCAALVASALPARRASRVDPLITLRDA
ncbi:MAG: FtsX-like permease family protein [Luteitalea sp.]|nr:FtsX-like permease family protein [Luteitalea sp.]